MATTGIDLNRIFDAKIDKAYSGFYNSIKKNDLFKEALTKSIEERYRGLDEQKEYDDLSSLIKLNQVFALNNNKIYVTPIHISDISGALTKTVTTTIPHNVIAGDNVAFSDVQGLTTTPAINGISFAVISATGTTFTIDVTATSGTYIANSGQIIKVTSSSGIDKLIGDYNHLLAVKTKYNQQLNCKMIDASNAQPIRIKVDKRNNLKSGDKIEISGIIGNTNANGTYFIKKINSFNFDLYLDKDFLNPITGNGVYQGISSITRPLYKYVTNLFSNQKISAYEMATIDNPKVERGNQMLQIAPYDYVCSEISIDYISDTIQGIDVADAVVNLEDYYHIDFLYFVLDTAANLFSQRIKDDELYKTSSVELSK